MTVRERRTLIPSGACGRGLARRVELGTERESLLEMLDENADFGGQSAAGGPYRKDWHCSLEGGQEADDGTFSEFRGEKPRWRLGNPQVFQDTHPHLFSVVSGTEEWQRE